MPDFAFKSPVNLHFRLVENLILNTTSILIVKNCGLISKHKNYIIKLILCGVAQYGRACSSQNLSSCCLLSLLLLKYLYNTKME